MPFYLPGIKQTAKLVNSTLMELIIGVTDITDESKDNTEVIKEVKYSNTRNKMKHFYKLN